MRLRLLRRKWGAQLFPTTAGSADDYVRWFWTRWGAEDFIRARNRITSHIDGRYRLIRR